MSSLFGLFAGKLSIFNALAVFYCRLLSKLLVNCSWLCIILKQFNPFVPDKYSSSFTEVLGEQLLNDLSLLNDIGAHPMNNQKKTRGEI